MSDSDLTDTQANSIENPSKELPTLIQAQTPARIFVGRAGPAFRTTTQLELRQDHAAALDAVHKEVDINQDFETEFIQRYQLFDVTSCASGKSEYLMRPDLGRRFSETSKEIIAAHCQREVDLQVVIGDGLSAAAVIRQTPELLQRLAERAVQRGWSFGQPFFVHYCRVGILNDIGDLLKPTIVVLLIGERPGLITAESLSAYMAYRPCNGHTDAQRNLISNIHARGVPLEMASNRVLALAEKMRLLQMSGVSVKEDLQQIERLPL